MSSSSRPTTPNTRLRTPARRHLHRSSGVYNVLPQSPKVHYPIDPDNLPLESQENTERFGMFSDALEELDLNMTNLQLIHEAISDGFNESFASFLYGLSITMWCVDFPGCPSRMQWERVKEIGGLDARIGELKDRIKAAREDNNTLKTTLSATKGPANSTKKTVPVLKIPKRVTKPPIGEPDDTYSSNDASFVLNPSNNNRALHFKEARSGIAHSTSLVSRNNGKTPNLNQPPRYMQGLFHRNQRPLSANPTQRKPTTNRIQKPKPRPPFR